MPPELKKLSLVFKELEPQRLDRVLEADVQTSFPELLLSRSKIAELIKSGSVRVDNTVVTKPGQKVKTGALIEADIVQPRMEKLDTYDFPLDILFEDESLIVINKPPGISMHPGAGNRTKTLVNILLERLKEPYNSAWQVDRPGIVHRLDKDTSGIVVVAKDVGTHAALAKQFEERTVKRAYRALAFRSKRKATVFEKKDSGSLKTFIGRDPKNRQKMAVLSEGGKEAITHWSIVERLDQATLFDIVLGTGRTHQIRVHLSHFGAPLIGDPLYGPNLNFSDSALSRAVKNFGRQALHAYKLGFLHPRSRKELYYEVGLPDDLNLLIEAFKTGA